MTVADLEVVAFRPETESRPSRPSSRRARASPPNTSSSRPTIRIWRGFRIATAILRSGSKLWPDVRPRIHALDKRSGPQDREPDRRRRRSPGAGILVDALHFDRSQSSLADLRTIPAQRLHYWQLCDGPAERPATTEQLIHAAREERMFPGEGGIDLIGLTRAMPDDLTISIEVPTVQLAKSVDAERGHAGRSRRARPWSRGRARIPGGRVAPDAARRSLL